MYADVIEPFLIRHEQQIDKALVEIQSSTRRTIAVYGKQLALFIGGLIKQLVRKVRMCSAHWRKKGTNE